MSTRPILKVYGPPGAALSLPCGGPSRGFGRLQRTSASRQVHSTTEECARVPDAEETHVRCFAQTSMLRMSGQWVVGGVCPRHTPFVVIFPLEMLLIGSLTLVMLPQGEPPYLLLVGGLLRRCFSLDFLPSLLFGHQPRCPGSMHARFRTSRTGRHCYGQYRHDDGTSGTLARVEDNAMLPSTSGRYPFSKG